MENNEKKTQCMLCQRGTKLESAIGYNTGDKILHHGWCKLDNYDWLKDYQNTPTEGTDQKVAEVRFKNDRKDFYSYPSELNLEEGELVAVEASIGHDVGIVTLIEPLVNKQMDRKHVSDRTDLKKIYRRARVTDVEKWIEATNQENGTLFRSREIALDLNLDMKLNDIEYQGDKTKAIFYYTAEGRVDFRELIKKLADEFHVRVEMRQIGVRQESAKLGGVGSCGRELCCSSWICNFQSVTTNVARIQQLSPNPQKLAGQCGKLKCCLNYEYETYVDAMKEFSDPHIILKTQKGNAIHQKSDIFKGVMWYSYTDDRNNMMAIPVAKVKEIIAQNKKGSLPEKLEDFALLKEQKTDETFYGDDGKEVDLSRYE